MQEVRLKVQKRAFPSHGRARVNEAVLPVLGVKEGEAVRLTCRDPKKTIDVIVFADSMADHGHIRLSEEDMKVIGAAEGDEVVAVRVVPLTEQVQKGAQDLGAQVGAGAEGVSKSVSGTLSPVAKQIDDAVKGTAAKIPFPTKEDINKALGSVTKSLKPGEAKKLESTLSKSEGAIISAKVGAPASGRALPQFDFPKGVVLAAIQRKDEIIIPDSTTKLMEGDLVFFVGKKETLDAAVKMIGE